MEGVVYFRVFGYSIYLGLMQISQNRIAIARPSKGMHTICIVHVSMPNRSKDRFKISLSGWGYFAKQYNN